MRSKNPDLIFDEILTERAKKIAEAEFDPSANALEKLTLDRVTLFVTHKCNLHCKYCNGPHLDDFLEPDKRKEMLSSDMSLEQYQRLLEEWTRYGLKHIHFTGGEATLNKYLSEFVKLATEKGIASTLTTNGTAMPGLYRRLVENGLSEIRISIDSIVNEEFDELVGVKGSCQKIKANLAELAEMRDTENKNIFIILNACIGRFNIENIASTMLSLIDLKPNDVKLLAVAEEGEYIQGHASRRAVDYLRKLAQEKGSFELLQKKIPALFRKDSFGLEDCAAQHEMMHCYVPLTERTLDAKYVYPCSIYLRYKGQPIIESDASFEDQQKAIDGFVHGHNCRLDSICTKNCTNCCKKFNIETNKRIRAHQILKKAEQSIITIDKISHADISKFLVLYDRIQQTNGYASPFAVLKPQGVKFKSEILGYLKDQGIVILNQIPVDDWLTFSRYLYFKADSDPEHRIAKSRAHRVVEPNNALYLELEQQIPEKKLFRIKRELREWYGEPLGFYLYNGKIWVCRSNCIHVPDYEDLERESKVVKYFLNNS
jgi:MoaA/NifB/PqqE/SkfB family radical SAM enzyme